MTKIDIPSQNVYVQQFTDVFLLVVATEISILELLPDVCQLLINPFLLQLPCSCISQVRYELDESSHRRCISRASPAQKAGCRSARQLEGYTSLLEWVVEVGGALRHGNKVLRPEDRTIVVPLARATKDCASFSVNPQVLLHNKEQPVRGEIEKGTSELEQQVVFQVQSFD